MAKVRIKGFDAYEAALGRLERGATGIAKRAVFTGAGILAKAMKEQVDENTEGSSTGEMRDSIGISPIMEDANGGVNARVGFSGYDSYGVPNVLKARAMNSGTSVRTKKPITEPAIKKVEKEILEEMGQEITEGIVRAVEK